MEIVSYDPFEELESRSSKEKRKDKGKRENAGLGTLDGLRNPEGVEGEIFKRGGGRERERVLCWIH